MARKSVAASRGHDGKRGVGVNKRARHLVDGAISSYCNHDVEPLLGSLACNLHRVTCIFRVADFDSETLGVNASLNGFDHFAFASGARNGVDDEKNALSHRRNGIDVSAKIVETLEFVGKEEDEKR